MKDSEKVCENCFYFGVVIRNLEGKGFGTCYHPAGTKADTCREDHCSGWHSLNKEY